MAHVQSGRKLREEGTIALVIDVFEQKEWFRHPSYSVYHAGVLQRAKELGFKVDYFFLREAGVTATSVDRILHSRGIRGLVLAPPYLGNGRLVMNWQRYACIGTGYGWEQQQLDRVAHDHTQNVITAFQHLTKLGSSRIGLCLPQFYAAGRGTRWIDGYLVCQQCVRKSARIPVFIASGKDDPLPEFRKWINRWRPDTLLTLYGNESAWLQRLGLNYPGDIGVACLIRPPGSSWTGINDRYDQVGAATVELLAAKIALNQTGIPPFPKITLIEGQWVAGSSVLPRKE